MKFKLIALFIGLSVLAGVYVFQNGVSIHKTEVTTEQAAPAPSDDDAAFKKMNQ